MGISFHQLNTRAPWNTVHGLLLFPTSTNFLLNDLRALDLFKLLFTIAEGLGAHLHLIHHREEQSGKLAVGFACVVESTAALNATTGPAKDDHWKLIVIVESAGPQVNVFNFPALDLLFSFYSGEATNAGGVFVG